MHTEAVEFLQFVKTILPSYFDKPLRVLDVGSGDINGNNRSLFHRDSEYHGNDMAPAKNVTIVSKTSELPFADETFDVIVSSECFEHDPEYAKSLQKIVCMLKSDGLFFFTCASTGRREHGTRRTTPHDSYATIAKNTDWQDYYKNLTITDIADAIQLDTFATRAAYYRKSTCDLYFYGVKTPNVSELPSFSGNTVSRVL